MIRQSSLFLLLAFTTASFAQPLYKWAEKDGSITFSPTRPPDGIAFEKIEPQSQAGALSADTAASEDAPQPVAAMAAPAKSVVAPRVASQKIDRNEPSMMISRSADGGLENPATGVATSATPVKLDARQVTDSQQVASIAARNKQSRCQDLQKRVVSLERRLKSRLTPEDMDNTVIHMARYQRSFDQHCEQ